MRTINIAYWITTILIVVFEGVLPALTSQTEMAKEGIRHLGYPEYFGTALAVFKVLGAIILIVPQIPARMKEWAYAGFGFDFTFAFISYLAVEGFVGAALFPLVVFMILIVSYVTYHKRLRARNRID
ncbi:MAG: DoxX family protein [Flavobacterium sp.]|nr:MAG: DoxX family protein [Flavobacterium sp.]